MKISWRTKTNPDSHCALADARSNLERVKQTTNEVDRLVSDLKYIRERNHFADAFKAAIERG